MIDQALVTEQVIDDFDATGIKKPNISILSDEFLLEVKNMQHKNIALCSFPFAKVLRKIQAPPRYREEKELEPLFDAFREGRHRLPSWEHVYLNLIRLIGYEQLATLP